MGKKMSEPPSGRRGGQRKRNKRFLIVHGGKETEAEYFDMLKSELPVPRTVDVKVEYGGEGRRDPKSLVEFAKRLLDDDKKEARKEHFDPYAKAWVVTDCDLFKMGKACTEAKRADVDMVISNPCFEVWLIDHVKVCPPSCCDTQACEKYAISCGVVTAKSPRQTAAKKQKQINEEVLRGQGIRAIKNAEAHCDDAKRVVREADPGNVKGYEVWTDMPELVNRLHQEAGRPGAVA